jgi:hypothetical protein
LECNPKFGGSKKTVYEVCTEVEGENFGREKDKAVPLEAKQEQKNAKCGRWSVLSPGIFTSAKRHSVHFTGDWMDLGASAEGFGKSRHSGFSAPDPAGRSE